MIFFNPLVEYDCFIHAHLEVWQGIYGLIRMSFSIRHFQDSHTESHKMKIIAPLDNTVYYSATRLLDLKYSPGSAHKEFECIISVLLVPCVQIKTDICLKVISTCLTYSTFFHS